MLTTIQVGTMAGTPHTMTIEHPFPLTQKWLDNNQAVIYVSPEPKETKNG